MRQDPNAVPRPRASREQISDYQDQDQQATTWQPPAWQPAAPGPVNGWQGGPGPRPADQEAEATLGRIRVALRKARRMQVVCVLLAACAAAIFLIAAASHQLDGHTEMLTPVLLLTSAVNFRRYGQRVAKYRTAEADILTRFE